ncbi:MAG: flagellar hook-length control protein FliK [Pseudooceanicola sp.]
MARQVSDQIAQAARQVTEGRIELTLRPQELGHLRMVLHPTEAGLTLAIQAERAETLDLVRRHAEALTSALEEAGYDDVQLSFGHGTDEQEGADAGDGPGSAPGAEPETDSEAPAKAGPAPHDRGASGGLDMRM